MYDLLNDNYLYLKAFHIIAVIAWMAGLLYLPRLFVYHAEAEVGSPVSETFKVMERRLLRIIMTPAMIVAWGLGLTMLWVNPGILVGQGWMHGKLLLVVLMSGAHGMQSKWRREFEADKNTRPAGFYRIMNEVPTAFMILIVLLAVVKPF